MSQEPQPSRRVKSADLTQRCGRGVGCPALGFLSDITQGGAMTLEELQRLYFRWQWANGTALYAAKHGTAVERHTAEQVALDGYEEYLLARDQWEQREVRSA